MKIVKNEKGFSLTELLIVIGISSIISYGLFATLLSGERQLGTANTKATLQDSARSGLYQMSEEIRASSPDQITISGDNSSISFKVPPNSNAVGDDFSINWSGAETVSYSLGGTGNTQLIRTSTSGQTRIIANDVTGVQFVGNGNQPSLITATVSMQRTNAQGRLVPAQPLQMTAQMKIRNGYADNSNDDEQESDHNDDDHGCDHDNDDHDDDHGNDHEDDDDHGSDH